MVRRLEEVATIELSGTVEILDVIPCVAAIAIGKSLALDTAHRPGHCGDAFRADRLFAVEARTEFPIVNPP